MWLVCFGSNGIQVGIALEIIHFSIENIQNNNFSKPELLGYPTSELFFFKFLLKIFDLV